MLDLLYFLNIVEEIKIKVESHVGVWERERKLGTSSSLESKKRNERGESIEDIF